MLVDKLTLNTSDSNIHTITVIPDGSEEKFTFDIQTSNEIPTQSAIMKAAAVGLNAILVERRTEARLLAKIAADVDTVEDQETEAEAASDALKEASHITAPSDEPIDADGVQFVPPPVVEADKIILPTMADTKMTLTDFAIRHNVDTVNPGDTKADILRKITLAHGVDV